MGKYEPLARYLESRKEGSWGATFAQVEEKLGFPLPPSAFEHRAWWSNQQSMGHSQKEGWQAAGWETSDVDLQRRTVRFVRRESARVREVRQDYKAPESIETLWRRARELTGIEDRAELEAHVLNGFL